MSEKKMPVRKTYTKGITFFVTPEQSEALNEHCKQHSINKSKYLRQLFLDNIAGVPKAETPTEDYTKSFEGITYLLDLIGNQLGAKVAEIEKRLGRYHKTLETIMTLLIPMSENLRLLMEHELEEG